MKKRPRPTKQAPDKRPVENHDPTWTSGLSGKLAGQGFMGLPPPRNPPARVLDSKAGSTGAEREREVDHSHQTAGDMQGQAGKQR